MQLFCGTPQEQQYGILSVSQGEIELVVGANTYHLKAGSAIAFDSREDHKYINNGEVDAIAHVVRCFDDENITHVDGRIDPVSDVETIHTCLHGEADKQR